MKPRSGFWEIALVLACLTFVVVVGLNQLVELLRNLGIIK